MLIDMDDFSGIITKTIVFDVEIEACEVTSMYKVAIPAQ